ncbi:hypothetical protein DACRYDRAFT_106234 [Dacryopinax primogenitus]|uniref:Uncharacterized protein n=1 Tax=Dacryopinax primogenitus (strain DJM 731) TaxID=1858805 RepID=M5FYC6_DACPD|nr:uncharacterized protein DACRYDRAFT_106234 [Dacryopinax primogenitus]EJU03056.1 hypothetical protein DACRYDRAFT_106234 [Dacryopinax primogenitus]
MSQPSVNSIGASKDEGNPSAADVSPDNRTAHGAKISRDFLKRMPTPRRIERFRAELLQQNEALASRLELESAEIEADEKRLRKRKHRFETESIRKKQCEEKLKSLDEGLEGIIKYKKASSIFRAKETGREENFEDDEQVEENDDGETDFPPLESEEERSPSSSVQQRCLK